MPNTYSPLTSLRIKDFQSLEDATIELGRLTVLVGPGDVGKSAILRALRAACLNDGADEDIRHGTSRCEVELFFDGQAHRGDASVRLRWWKDRGKGGCYELNGKTFIKTGGAVPKEVAAVLGIGLIEVDATTELTPQLSDQHDQPFVLWETGSKRARILGKATRLDMVVSAQMTCKKELDQTKRAAEEASTTLADVEERLAALPDYEALEGEVTQTEGNLKTIEDNLLLVRRARELADRIEEVHSRATAVNVAPLRERLDVAAAALEVAERARFLVRRIPELEKQLTDLTGRGADHEEALLSFALQLEAACEEAGVCPTCGGLLNHEECGA